MLEKKKQRVLYLASKNQHKLKEFRSILEDVGFDVKLCSELDPDIKWDEVGATFADNATIKALAVKKLTNACVLADDSGLEVSVLNKAPGVFSSRYGGVEGDDENNNRCLLNALAKQTDRDARFVCCLVFIDEEGRKVVFQGYCQGVIAEAKRGTGGFGYDPLFIVPSLGKSFGELSAEEKNRLSHRANAVKQFKNLVTSDLLA